MDEAADNSILVAEDTENPTGHTECESVDDMQIDMIAEQTSPGVKVSEVKDPDPKDTQCDLVLSESGNDNKIEEKKEAKDIKKVNGLHDMDIDKAGTTVLKKEKCDMGYTEMIEEHEELIKEKDQKVNSVKVKKELSELEIEREVKRELREAVEIRIPRIRSKRDADDTKWDRPSGAEKSHKSSKRPETPPLQKLMRQEFSPLKSDSILMHSSAKRLKDSSYSSKEGFTSKLASVIIPSSSISVSPKTASHPKQLLSHSLANLRSSSFSSKLPFSTSALLSRPYSVGNSVLQNHSASADSDQPLDLSKKAGKSSGSESTKERSSSTASKSDSKKQENGTSSTSLQSLQQKFGGDFHLRGLRKPLNYMLYGPEIPALHQALLHTASMAVPHFPFPLSNGLPKYTPEKQRHRNSTPSPSSKSKLEESSKPVKKEEHFISEKSTKRESVEKSELENGSVDEKQGENYTNHLCTCGKWFDGLYSLSLHLQETGHLPARNKSVSLMEYPKLVRGQDMWLNQESEQTRRILRCIQCGESFKTLPLLTVHMMKTQHYTKIVSSEHARRTHKCSAYCDKEQDKDCVFKCKVCQETFPDMEGLANHMLMSGHHKKQSPRPSQGYSDSTSSIHFKKRKRYSFEECPNPYGNPSIASMFELKRHTQTDQLGSDLSIDDLDDSTITCENCGHKIETKIFVEHVRACLGQKLREDVARLEKEKENLKKLEKERKRLLSLTEKEKHAIELLKSPVKKVKLEKQVSEDESEESKKSTDDTDNTEGKIVKLEANINENNEVGSSNKMDKANDSDSDSNAHTKIKGLVQPELNDSDDEIEAGEITDKSKSILKEIQTLVESKSYAKHEHNKSEDVSAADAKKSRSAVPKKLEIIDPDNVKEESSTGGSALSAMESFIKKSFSNKFDYKKGNIVISPHTSADATIHTSSLATSGLGFDSLEYLNRYKNFYAALNLNNGLRQGCDKEKGKDDTQENLKNGLRKSKDSKRKSGTLKESSDDEKESGRGSVKSESSDTSGVLDKDLNLETKYLAMEDGEEGKTEKGDKSSALDNLSSFVYGQTLTSEHPLDSLQKLITKSDIPKLMAGEGGGRFKYLPPHLQMHHANLDLTLPLNLTVKSPKGESDEDDSRSRNDEDSLSDYEAMNSPSNSDGEPMEYRCAACSRRFASKGSYRYHLSRCHLSSVKRYGIKEAFNMSPYVYLPLDHTAKFSKYYEMAKELANKSKETRAKSN